MFNVAGITPNGSNSHVNFGAGGHQEARGGQKLNIFYVEGVLAELDTGGEFIYERASGKLHIFPNSTKPLGSSTLIVPQLATLISMNGADGVVLSRLTIKHSLPTFMRKYESLPSGDWSIYRGGAIKVEQAERVTIQKCTLDHLGGLGIFFSNHVVDSVIAGNELVGIADTGIALVGSAFYADGTQPTHPERNLVTLNHIHEVGVVGKGQAAYFQALASHNTVSRNVMFNGPRTGIECNDGFG
jgi:hypothetical protein